MQWPAPCWMTWRRPSTWHEEVRAWGGRPPRGRAPGGFARGGGGAEGGGAGRVAAVAAGLRTPVECAPWPPVALSRLREEDVRPWVLPLVYQRLLSGGRQFLAELRPAVALFVRFGGLDFEHDRDVAAKLDAYIR